MPITQRNTLAPNNLVYTTGNYINPLWIISLAPAKVGSGIPQWNASQLQGRSISPNYPLIGDVLQWNGSSWFPTGVTDGGTYTSTGVMSFNSRTGVVVLTSGDVTGALTYTPYNNTNPSGYISSGYYTANGGITLGNVLLNGAISGTLSNTTITPIDSTPYASGDCIKYIIKAKYGSAIQATEVLVVSDGTDSYMTEYGLLYSSGKLLDISADLNSSNIRLLGQATYSNTSVHMMKVLIA